jgi:hypothetical protein
MQADAEEGGHGAGRLLAGPGHRLAAGHDQLDPVLEAEGATGDQRRVLAQAVSGTGGGGQSDALDGVEDHQAEHRGGQLRVLGFSQLLNRGPEEQLSQIPVCGGRGFLDDFPRRMVDPGLTHAGALRTLTGEGEDQHVSEDSIRRGQIERTVWHAGGAVTQVRCCGRTASRNRGASLAPVLVTHWKPGETMSATGCK